MVKTVIHRDGTFDYNGEKWHAARLGARGSADDVWYIWRDEDGAEPDGAWTWDTLAELREFIDDALAKNLDLKSGEPLGPRYITAQALREMSGRECDEYMDSLVEAGMDDGPEWDRLFKVWEQANDQ